MYSNFEYNHLSRLWPNNRETDAKIIATGPTTVHIMLGLLIQENIELKLKHQQLKHSYGKLYKETNHLRNAIAGITQSSANKLRENKPGSFNNRNICRSFSKKGNAKITPQIIISKKKQCKQEKENTITTID